MTFRTLCVGLVGTKGHPSLLCLHQEPAEGLTLEHRQMAIEPLLSRSLLIELLERVVGGLVSHVDLLGPHPSTCCRLREGTGAGSGRQLLLCVTV